MHDLANKPSNSTLHNVNENISPIDSIQSPLTTPNKANTNERELAVHAADEIRIAPLEQRLVHVATKLSDGEYNVTRGPSSGHSVPTTVPNSTLAASRNRFTDRRHARTRGHRSLRQSVELSPRNSA